MTISRRILACSMSLASASVAASLGAYCSDSLTSASASSSLLLMKSSLARRKSTLAKPVRAWPFFGSSRSARLYSFSASLRLGRASARSPCELRRSTIQWVIDCAQPLVLSASSATSITATRLNVLQTMVHQESGHRDDEVGGRPKQQLRQQRARHRADDEI